MILVLYTAFYYLLSPFLCVMWLIKSLRPPQYREPLLERFGFVKKQENPTVWFHAVSMGESKGAISIIQELRKSHPELPIVVTTTTKTGARQIHQSLGDSVQHFYSPCDLPGSIRRFTTRIQPKLLVIMETELWPNWMNHLKNQDIPVVLANARLSASSANKYTKIERLFAQMMAQMSLVLPVSQRDAKRFMSLGLEEAKCHVTGNIKYDQQPPKLNAKDYYPTWGDDCLVWVAASTHKGEDEVVLQAHKEVHSYYPNSRLVLVPRHPERFEQVASLIKQYGFSLARRSKPSSWSKESQVLLGDSMGELMLAYQLSDVSFVGGSLVDVGGHNAIEPAILGKPILSGAIVYNFQELFDLLREEQAADFAESSAELAQKVMQLFSDDEKRQTMGAHAERVIRENRGALDKTVTEIKGVLPD